MSQGPEPAASPASGDDLESTTVLLSRVREGDTNARERLVHRYLATLQHWAHGRLPAGARDLAETQDLVQVTLLKALDHVDGFEPRHEGAFLAYLRKILLNEIRMEIRKVSRRPDRLPMRDDVSASEPSPLERTIGSEMLETYETALAGLTEEERQGVILRLEFGFTHKQVAQALGKPTPDAARMLVARALVRLTETMHGHT